MLNLKKTLQTIVGGLSGSAADAKIVVLDIGCRWGFAERFLSPECQKSFAIYGFDPDAQECARLQASYDHLPVGYVSCVPVALAGLAGTRNLYITKEPACSSLYPPIHFLTERYPGLGCASLEKVVATQVTTLDEWVQQEDLKVIDYIKLDTQGSELEILKGGDRIVETARCIDIEVEFNPIYEGQSLFGETDSYLRAKGFTLWRLSNLVHYSLGAEKILLDDKNTVYFDGNVRQESDAFGGQLFWADARYINRDVLRSRPLASARSQRDRKLFEVIGMRDVVAHMQNVAQQS